MTPAGAAVRPIGAAILAGFALWLSRASFDVAGTDAAPVRVAMFPSLPELVGLVAMTLLIVAGMAALARSRGPRPQEFWSREIGEVLVPVFALSLLVLPYLPWIPDAMPALWVLAGPARIVLWMIVIGQVLWIFVPALAARGVRTGTGSSVLFPSMLIFAASAAVYAYASLRVGSGREIPWLPSILASAVAAMAWIWSAALARSKSAATFAWAAAALTLPAVVNAREWGPAPFADAARALGGLSSGALAGIPRSALGLLFDQEFGIVTNAPVLILAFLGLAGLWRTGSHRVQAAGLLAAMVALIALPASVDPWWRRSMVPGRPLLLLLPLLAPPIAWLHATLSERWRAGAHALLLASLAMTAAALFGGVALSQDGDGAASVLVWMSPTWQLWPEAPTLVAGGAGAALARIVLWLGSFALVGWMLSRRPRSAGRAALETTIGGTALALVLVSVTARAMPSPDRRFAVEGRALFPLLETFDPVARPLIVRYDPFTPVDAPSVPSLFTLSAEPGQRTDPQPVRVALNARFRLPAGSYELDLKGAESAAPIPAAAIALQMGREGPPLATWPMPLEPGVHVRRRFDVPLDAEFIGFRAPRQVEQAIGELRVTPISVVERRRRFQATTVLSAAAFAPATAFFHDSSVYPEAEGFWVRGRASARMTLLKTGGTHGLTLAVHSGARPNVVTLSSHHWSHTLELVPGVTERVVVPSDEGAGFVPLSIATADGFVPAEIEQSRDRRLLGAWIAFIPDDNARTSAAP